MWNPETIKALRQRRGESQTAFAQALGVSRPTVSEWENGKGNISVIGAAALDRLAAGPRDTSQDYWRGVLYAAEAMSDTVTRLLREARQDTEHTIMQTAKAMLAAPEPADELPRQGTGKGSRRTASIRGSSRDG